MKNPNKYIRKAFVDLLTAKGVIVFDKQVPKNYSTPDKYVLVTSQTRLKQELCRELKEWDCTIVLDLIAVQDLSYVSSVELDDYEEIVMNTFNYLIPVEGFEASYLEEDGSPRDLSITTDTQSILRKVMTYRIVVKELKGILNGSES